MNRMTRLALLLTLAMGMSFNLMAWKSTDLVGTWVGLATLEGIDNPNEITLVLEMKDDSLAGHMTDQFGLMSKSPIFEVRLEESIFNFSVIISGRSGKESTMVLKMNVEGDSMKGTLKIQDFKMNGTWEATKRK